MSKIRVHSLAKQLGLTSQEMVQKIRDLGLEVKSYMSTIDEETAKLLDHKAEVLDAVLDGKETDEENLLTELIRIYESKID